MEEADRVIIVDGYNVIRSTERYASLAEQDMDAARAMLISDLAAHVQKESSAVVIFDAAGNPQSTGASHEVIGVEVVFSPYGVDADSVIEEMCGRLIAEKRRVTVVTSDAGTQWVVLGQGATRVSAEQFASGLADELPRTAEDVRSGSTRHTIDQRIDAKTRAALSRWARGQR